MFSVVWFEAIQDNHEIQTPTPSPNQELVTLRAETITLVIQKQSRVYV